MSSINRKLANLITSTGDVTSAALDNAASMSVFSSLDSLPTSSLSAGDQALVGQRLYVSNGSGWYSVALINATPTLALSQDGSIALSNVGTATTITLTAADSDNSYASLTLTAESGGDFFKMATVSQDSSVFTITPRSKDSATSLGWDGSSTLTFKASDGISFASNQVTFTLTFTIANSQYTSVLIKADDAATDNQVNDTDNPLSITEGGNIVSSAFTPYHPGGYSLHFDGTDDRIVFDTGAAVGTADFCIEGWVMPHAEATKGVFQMSGDTAGLTSSGYADTLAFGRTTGNRWMIYGAGAQTYTSDDGGLTLGDWVHFAYVRNSNVCKVYINGTEQISLSDSTNYTARYCAIGGLYTASYLMNVTVKDFRVVVGSPVYTSAFTPTTTALTAITNTKLLTCQDPYIEDNSATGASPTIVGNPEVRRVSPYTVTAEYSKTLHGGSLYLDGSGDYATVGTASDGALTGTFTIECWFMLKEAYTTAVNTIVSNYDGSANNWQIQLRTGGQLWLTANVGQVLSYTLNPLQNVWYHVAASNDAANNTGKLFVNGRLVDSHTSAATYDDGDMAASSVPITIGRLGNNTSQDFNGYIADLRILSGTHLRTAAFTPPTSPLTKITNTKILTATNKNDLYDIASGYAIVKKDGTALPASNAVRKFTTSSSWRSASYHVFQEMDRPIGPGNFTIEGWVYFDAVSDQQGIFQTKAVGNADTSTFSYGTSGIALGISSANWRMYYANGSTVNATQSASATTWYHVAVVRNSGTTKLYVNGTATSISVSDTNDYTETEFLLGGYYSSSYTMTGYLQDWRVSPGLARYTSNFTPPTDEFQG
jgi:hypothetical protein